MWDIYPRWGKSSPPRTRVYKWCRHQKGAPKKAPVGNPGFPPENLLFFPKVFYIINWPKNLGPTFKKGCPPFLNKVPPKMWPQKVNKLPKKASQKVYLYPKRCKQPPQGGNHIPFSLLKIYQKKVKVFCEKELCN